jgi:hypothetical protein
MALSVMIDTSAHFVSATGTPPAAPVQAVPPKTPDTVSAVSQPVRPVGATPGATTPPPATPLLKKTPAAPNPTPASTGEAPAKAVEAPAKAVEPQAPAIEVPVQPVEAPARPAAPLTPAETYHAIEHYKQRETAADEGIEKEQFEIDKIKAAQDSLDAQLNAVKNKK